MNVVLRVAAGLAVLLLAGCVSPEEQRAMDQGKCVGFGFSPGTDAFAQCMMGITQHREAQQAEDRRQRELNDAIAAKAQAERDARAAREAANKPADSGMPSMPSMPDTSDMTCTRDVKVEGNTTTTHENCHN